MTSSFDPRHNSDPQVLNNILLVDQDTTLTKKQKPKKRSFLGKFFHWLTSPRERISHIREKFASFCNLSNEHEAKLDEVANIYANSRYFNERVITKHNISKAVSYLFFWNKVPLIDTKALEQHIRGILSEHATSIESAKSIPEKIQALHRASVALSGTQALKTFSESENDLGYLRQQLETRLTVKVKELKEEIQLITSKMTSSTQLSIEELQLLDKLDTLLPFLPESQDNNHKLIELINSKKRADNLFKRVCTELADTIDVTSQARELLTDKFLSQESKKILTELLDLQQFHIAACGLCQKR